MTTHFILQWCGNPIIWMLFNNRLIQKFFIAELWIYNLIKLLLSTFCSEIYKRQIIGIKLKYFQFYTEKLINYLQTFTKIRQSGISLLFKRKCGIIVHCLKAIKHRWVKLLNAIEGLNCIKGASTGMPIDLFWGFFQWVGEHPCTDLRIEKSVVTYFGRVIMSLRTLLSSLSSNLFFFFWI